MMGGFIYDLLLLQFSPSLSNVIDAAWTMMMMIPEIDTHNRQPDSTRNFWGDTRTHSRCGNKTLHNITNTYAIPIYTYIYQI